MTQTNLRHIRIVMPGAGFIAGVSLYAVLRFFRQTASPTLASDLLAGFGAGFLLSLGCYIGLRLVAYRLDGAPHAGLRSLAAGFARAPERSTAQRERDLLVTLYQTAHDVGLRAGTETILRDLLAKTVTLTDSRQGIALLLDESRERIRYRITLEQESLVPLDMRAGSLLEEGLVAWIVRERKPALVPDTARDPRWLASPGSAELRSALAVPLAYNNRLLGIITLAHEQPGHYDQEHLRLLEALAAFAALALEHARMRDTVGDAQAAQAELGRQLGQAEPTQAAPAWSEVAGYIPPPLVDALVRSDPAGLAELEQPQVQDIIVVFVDMRGLVDSGHRIRLETLAGEVLDSYYQIATECIVRWGGYVDKFLGGMILAIFGYPVPRPDDARRALRAALELRRVTARMRTYWRARLGLHASMAIGIAYGRAAVGGIGPRQRRDYTAIGDAVVIAARLRELARTGEILVAAEVIEALDQPAGMFILEALQPLQLHSNARPQQIYRVDEPQNSAANYGNTYDIHRNDPRRSAHRRADAHLTGD